ncbi:MAG: sugar ABC transporter permease [Chloroflexi bacterium]|nr:sugar ABC transporter permease [Chloroflexota bacterium]
MATTAATVEVRRRPRFRSSTRVAYLYLLPAFLVMGIITFYPLLFQTWMSFTDYTLENLPPRGVAPEYVGLDNYVRVLTTNLNLPNYDFGRILTFNLWWAFSNVVIHVVLGVLIAVTLNRAGLRFRGFWRALYIVPVVIPPIIVATVWANMFDRDSGAINLAMEGVATLLRLPPDALRLDWLRQVQDPIPGLSFLPMAYFALLVANTWLGWPLNSVVATGALQSIPKELYEAAEIDGAGTWQRFRNVTIPYLRPAMLPYAIYGFVITFNLFYLSYFMSGGGPFGKTELLVTQAFRLVTEQRLYGVAAAFAVIMFFILLALTLVTNRVAKATASYAE